jgi:GTPase SAR1 family protein
LERPDIPCRSNGIPRPQTEPPPVKLFISYSHRDDAARDRLQTFLTPLERSGTVIVWTDRRLVGGERWDQEIKREIGTAELIVFLLSADFLASNYIYGVEMRIARERWEEGAVEILPIVVGECLWDSTWLSDLNVVFNGRLVRGRRSDDKWWTQFIRIILQRVKSLRPSQVSEREFAPIERYAEDIRGDYATRKEGVRPMPIAKVQLAHTELYARLQETVQSIRAAVSAVALSPVGQDLRSRLDLLEVENAERHVTVAIVGQVKAGKSTLVNAIARQDLSPRDIDAKTAFPIRIHSGKSQVALIAWRDGTFEPLSISGLEAKMEELRLSGHRDRVRELVITTPYPLLSGYGWIELLDTPGFDGWRREDTELTVGLIGRAVAVVLVYRHSQASSESFLELVEKLRSRNGLEVFSVCNSDPNFRDLSATEPEQLRRSMSQIEERLRVLGARHHVIDLRDSLNSRLGHASDKSPATGEATSIEELEQALRSILEMRDVLAFREAVSRLVGFCEDYAQVCEERAAQLRPIVESIEAEIRLIRDQERELLGLANAVRVAIGELASVETWVFGVGGGGVGGVAVASIITASLPILWPLAIGALAGSILGGVGVAAGSNDKKLKFLERLEVCKSQAAASAVVSDIVKSHVAALNWESRSAAPRIIAELQEDVARLSTAAVGIRQTHPAYVEYSALVSSSRALRSEVGSLTVLDEAVSRLLPGIE